MIEVSQLTKLYGPRTAVHDLSFSVGKGEVVGFLGPNGAGKSTTMRILTGFMPASSGTAKVCGFDVFDAPMEVKKRVGYLPENPPLYLEMRVSDYLEFAAALHGISGRALRPAVDSVIEKVGLGEVRARLIGNLSKGFRQRIGLAQALIHNPEVLILDEPTVGLDPKQIIEIRQLIRGLAGDHTVILSSHILPEVTATCQRIIVINRGKIVAQDTLEHLTARLKNGLVFTLAVDRVADDAISAIQALPGVSSAAKKDPTTISIQMESDSASNRPKIIETAVHKGMGVMEFRAETMSLEEVFLELTTSE